MFQIPVYLFVQQPCGSTLLSAPHIDRFRDVFPDGQKQGVRHPLCSGSSEMPGRVFLWEKEGQECLPGFSRRMVRDQCFMTFVGLKPGFAL